MLLERPGEIVQREELKQKLCSTDTFVDFDHGVNTAINRLREGLGDSAEKPGFRHLGERSRKTHSGVLRRGLSCHASCWGNRYAM